MPHVILKGPVAPEDIWLAFESTKWQEGNVIARVQDAFLSHDKKTLLLRSLIVDRGHRRAFFIKVLEKDGGLSISLEPVGAPDRSMAVQRLIGLCAHRLMEAVPELVVVSTNIPELIGPLDQVPGRLDSH